jgi:DNA-directed RNA polymerase subunit E'/Rpb7
MFYINRNLKTELFFSHYNMDRLQNDEEILKKLKDKVEGRCMQEYGYILQVTKNPNAKSNAGIDIGVPKVEVNGCTVLITFSAISFKRTPPPTQLKRTTSSTS